jgi:hypothetical protein
MDKRVTVALIFAAVLTLTIGVYAYDESTISVTATVVDPISVSPSSFVVYTAYPNEQIPLKVSIGNSGTTFVTLTFSATITAFPGGNGSQSDFSYTFPSPYIALPGTSTMTIYLTVSNGAPPGTYVISIIPQRN